MTQQNDASQQLQEKDLMIRNLQSACNELEQQLNMYRVRSANIAAERDRAYEAIQVMKTQLDAAQQQANQTATVAEDRAAA